MAIPYYLQKNRLSSEPNAHAGHIRYPGTLDSKGLVQRMKQSGTTFSEAELSSFILLLNKTVKEELAKGYKLKFDFVTLRLTIRGVFTGISDLFDDSRHNLKVSATTSAELNESVARTILEKRNIGVASPRLTSLFNVRTGESDSVVSPGGIGRIMGDGLRFNFENPRQGVFFVSEDLATHVPVPSIESSTEKKIVFEVPELPVSSLWTLEVRIAYGRSGKIIRKGQLDHPLRVV